MVPDDRAGRAGIFDDGSPPSAGVVALPPEAEQEALAALAALDGEAAAAHSAAAAVTGDEQARAHLQQFAADHRRHADDLQALLSRRGSAPPPASTPPALLRRLAAFAGQVGAEAALLSLLASEELTNSSYDISMALLLDPEARALLERNYADEQRHLHWLQEQVSQLFDDDDLDEGDHGNDDGSAGGVAE